MVTIEIRFEEGFVKIRRFGSGEFKRWTSLRPGEVDRMTGWSFEELRGLGDGIWEFPATAATPLLPVVAGA
jgi:hypothetical protein